MSLALKAINWIRSLASASEPIRVELARLDELPRPVAAKKYVIHSNGDTIKVLRSTSNGWTTLAVFNHEGVFQYLRGRGILRAKWLQLVLRSVCVHDWSGQVCCHCGKQRG